MIRNKGLRVGTQKSLERCPESAGPAETVYYKSSFLSIDDFSGLFRRPDIKDARIFILKHAEMKKIKETHTKKFLRLTREESNATKINRITSARHLKLNDLLREAFCQPSKIKK
jgi:hypothetical protein